MKTSSLYLPSLLLRLVTALPGWPSHGPPPAQPSSSPPVVSTTSGQIHGKVDPALPNVAQYLGIPYAVPPVGDLRWTAPQLLNQPEAQIEATELPVSCMQFLTNQGNSLYVRNVLEFNLQGLNTTGAVSEDCLTISVWAPNNG
jgi:cholinesterase